MSPERFLELLKEWIRTKFTGVLTIHLHEGGIRKVRAEQDVK
jgi:hypothetical protein